MAFHQLFTGLFAAITFLSNDGLLLDIAGTLAIAIIPILSVVWLMRMLAEMKRPPSTKP